MWPAQGRRYTEILLLEVSLSPYSFQGYRLAIGYRGSEGIGAVLLRGFLLGFCVGLCDSLLDVRGDNILVWSTGREEFCCPVFFAATKQASRYVGKLHSV